MRKTVICIIIALAACACSKPDQPASAGGSDTSGDSGAHNTVPTQRAGDVANKANQQQRANSDATN